MRVSSLSANRKRVEITKEALEEGCKSNHALYLDALGEDLYLTPAGCNADDVRLANVLEFEPKAPDGYVYNIQLPDEND
jgi:hypothetical protein